MAGIHPTTEPFPSQPFHFQLNTPETGNLLQTAAKASLQVSQVLVNEAGHPRLVHLLTISCYRKDDGDLVTEVALDPDAGRGLMITDCKRDATSSNAHPSRAPVTTHQQGRNGKPGRHTKAKKIARTKSRKATAEPDAKTRETWDTLTVEKKKEFLTMLEGLSGTPLP